MSELVPRNKSLDTPAVQRDIALKVDEAIIKLYEHNYELFYGFAEHYVAKTKAIQDEQQYRYLAGYTDELLLDLGDELKSLRKEGASAIRSVARDWRYRI